MPLTSERARELAYLSHEVRRAKHLNLPRITHELGTLESPEDAKRWLEKAYLWTAAKMIPAGAGNACVRAVAEWQKIEESAATFEAIESLRTTVKELQAERDRLEQENAQLKLELDRARKAL